MKVRQASFALRVVRRRDGDAAIVYRRTLNAKQDERLTRIAAISPLAFAAGAGLLRAAVRASQGARPRLQPGPFIPLDNDWGARVACYALIAAGLRNPGRMSKAAENLRHADATEAAWWFGMMNRSNSSGKRAIRSLRILAEAVR